MKVFESEITYFSFPETKNRAARNAPSVSYIQVNWTRLICKLKNVEWQ